MIIDVCLHLYYIAPTLHILDFGIYGFFSDTISEVFFPPGGEHNLVYSYLVFGGGECDDRANELSRYNVLCVF